jgi:hypothetical protein
VVSIVKISSPETLPRQAKWFLAFWLFTGFLTQMSILPFIENNVGPFEICGLLALVFVHVFKLRTLSVNHPLLKTLLLLAVFGAISQIWLSNSQRLMGTVQTAMLFFLLVFVTLIYNTVLQHRLSPEFLLKTVTYTVLVVGPWIILQGAGSGGDIQAAGPFRNRAHMASYMLTAFWMVLMYTQWPGLKRRVRFVCYTGLALTLYPIAVSGRRSVYLSLIVGLVSLAFVMASASRGKRLRLFLTGALVVGFLGGLYTVADELTPQTAFFKERIGQIGDRLRLAAGTEEEMALEKTFYVFQREGVRLAFYERPLLGIGWGGFARSRFSPTGHEVHSTPLRFLAELGLVGLALYLFFIGILLAGSLRLFRSMRRTPYGASYLTLMIAIWSMSVSYIYNRHITERTFWILLTVFLSAEAFARVWHHLRKGVVSGSGPGGLHWPADTFRSRPPLSLPSQIAARQRTTAPTLPPAQ